MNERLHQLFGIRINKEEWIIIKRLDVCWNFQVGDQLDSYLKQFSRMNFPFKKAYNYGHNETVGFKNKSSEIIFYHKQQECKDHREPNEIIDQAKGLLRMEIRLSYSDMKKYSPHRKAKDLLTVTCFKHFTDKVLQKITFPAAVDGLDYNWAKSQSIKTSQMETILGFRQMQLMFNDTELKGLIRNNEKLNWA